MAKNSRAKGANGEREFAKLLTDGGYPSRRGQQFSGGAESPDVVCGRLRRFHFEVKRTQQFPYYAALEQSRRDAQTGSRFKIPVVAHRKNNREWVILLYASDFLTHIAPLFAYGGKTQDQQAESTSAREGSDTRDVPKVHKIPGLLANYYMSEMLARDELYTTYGDRQKLVHIGG